MHVGDIWRIGLLLLFVDVFGRELQTDRDLGLDYIASEEDLGWSLYMINF